MNKLSQKKRTQLVGVIALIVLVLAGLWFGLISMQQGKLTQITTRQSRMQKQLDQSTATIRDSRKVEAELSQASAALEKIESNMATGDLYSWTINTIREFKALHKVEIPQFGQIEGPRDATLIPQFPYKQATLTIAGNAHFYDLGKFVAELENQFPYVRIVNLTVEPSGGASTEAERLTFKLDFVTLVKPRNS